TSNPWQKRLPNTSKNSSNTSKRRPTLHELVETVMERKSAWLVIGGLLLVVFFFFAQYIPIMKGLTVAGHAVAGDAVRGPATTQSGKTESKLPGLENKDVVVTGPLISWMREAEREAPKTNAFLSQAPGASDRVAFAPRPK